jgi:hypothetical protein
MRRVNRLYGMPAAVAIASRGLSYQIKQRSSSNRLHVPCQAPLRADCSPACSTSRSST